MPAAPPYLTLVPVTPAAVEFAIQYPVSPVDGDVIPTATVYAALGAGVAVLGTAVTVPATVPVPWQLVQSWALLGKACAGRASTVDTRSPPARAVATNATLGMAIDFRPEILVDPPLDPASYS